MSWGVIPTWLRYVISKWTIEQLVTEHWYSTWKGTGTFELWIFGWSEPFHYPLAIAPFKIDSRHVTTMCAAYTGIRQTRLETSGTLSCKILEEMVVREARLARWVIADIFFGDGGVVRKLKHFCPLSINWMTKEDVQIRFDVSKISAFDHCSRFVLWWFKVGEVTETREIASV